MMLTNRLTRVPRSFQVPDVTRRMCIARDMGRIGKLGVSTDKKSLAHSVASPERQDLGWQDWDRSEYSQAEALREQGGPKTGVVLVYAPYSMRPSLIGKKI